jgi:hypothetical protein
MGKLKAWAVILFAVLVVACTGAPGKAQIKVRDAWLRAPGSMSTGGHGSQSTPEPSNMTSMQFNGAAYLTLVNPGESADRLLRASSEIAKAVELHKSELQGEVMTMQPVDSIEIPANGQVKLEPGGLHLMLIGLSENLTPGQKVLIQLVFEKAGEMTVDFEVRAP